MESARVSPINGVPVKLSFSQWTWGRPTVRMRQQHGLRAE